MDETLKRVLSILYDDWFRHDTLCPRAMWLVELPYDRPGYFLDIDLTPRRAYILEHIGVQQRSVLDWRRFYLMQWACRWHVGAEFPRRSAPAPDVYEIGVARFATNPENGNLVLDITFGPKYGRGYELTPTGKHLPGWIS